MILWLPALLVACIGRDTPTDEDRSDAPTVEVACDDGADDDGDGLVDCEDGDCTDACGEKACDDGVDDDGDGVTDCLDEDCWGTAACPTALAVRSGTMRRAVDTWDAYEGRSPGSWIPYALRRTDVAYIEVHQLEVLDLDAELQLGAIRCGMSAARMRLTARDSGYPFQAYPVFESPTLEAPCDGALSVVGRQPSEVVRSLFFVPSVPSPDAWPAEGPLELRTGRLPAPETRPRPYDTGPSWTPGARSRPGWVSAGLGARYPVALHASTTASTPPSDDCTLATFSTGPLTGCATATGPLTPATFSIDLTPRTLPEDATP